MNKIIAIGLLTIILLFVFGCAKEAVTPTPTITEPEVKETTITQTDDAITNADNTLEDLEDAETDTELDDIENVLNQI